MEIQRGHKGFSKVKLNLKVCFTFLKRSRRFKPKNLLWERMDISWSNTFSFFSVYIREREKQD